MEKDAGAQDFSAAASGGVNPRGRSITLRSFAIMQIKPMRARLHSGGKAHTRSREESEPSAPPSQRSLASPRL
jgi:hypothetical protein